MTQQIVIEREYTAPAQRLFELWTTKQGIESWWFEPYSHDTLVELFGTDAGERVVMTLEPLHDEEWTERIVMGRNNELDNLRRLLCA
jgi:uncharacterized protein YndB with AHSA1/START domain